MTKHDYRHGWIAAAVAIVLAGCAVPQAGPAGNSFAVEFSYPSLGVGPQPVGGLVLSEGLEARSASWAILDAIQSLQLSVIEPKLEANGLIPPGARWSTDMVPLEAAVIAEHNSRFPTMALPTDRFYSLQYSGEYAVSDKELSFRVESILYERGAAARPRRYDGRPYSGNFFFERLRTLITQKLPGAAKRGQP